LEDLSPDQVLIDPGPEDILALDEIWSLVDSKANTAWLGFAIGRRGQQLVGWHVGTRDQVSANYFLLEAISKRPQCNQDASKVKERLVDLNFSFPTNNQSSPVWPPCQSRFNLPSMPVRPQFATIFIFLGLLVFTLRTDQFNATFQPPLAERITVVPFIHYDVDRILPRPTTTFLGTAIFSIVASSSFISLGQVESRSAPIGTAWPSTTTIHLGSFPLLLSPKPGPLFGPGQTAIGQGFWPI